MYQKKGTHDHFRDFIFTLRQRTMIRFVKKKILFDAILSGDLAEAPALDRHASHQYSISCRACNIMRIQTMNKNCKWYNL
jgi:hypothetical protein